MDTIESRRVVAAIAATIAVGAAAACGATANGEPADPHPGFHPHPNAASSAPHHGHRTHHRCFHALTIGGKDETVRCGAP